jgi:hypothetical protein
LPSVNIFNENFLTWPSRPLKQVLITLLYLPNHHSLAPLLPLFRVAMFLLFLFFCLFFVHVTILIILEILGILIIPEIQNISKNLTVPINIKKSQNYFPISFKKINNSLTLHTP